MRVCADGQGEFWRRVFLQDPSKRLQTYGCVKTCSGSAKCARPNSHTSPLGCWSAESQADAPKDSCGLIGQPTTRTELGKLTALLLRAPRRLRYRLRHPSDHSLASYRRSRLSVHPSRTPCPLPRSSWPSWPPGVAKRPPPFSVVLCPYWNCLWEEACDSRPLAVE